MALHIHTHKIKMN